ncbi:hypothetical protein [Sphingopyxis microcysteis]|jgi:hypothetical protein|uniref:hypothetical protein n=1 Tax=Sphingopyxis microcysteis TaxID=2484145 RepID=UPI0014469E61|nr:hypothetical protein [Sphingopyxis microcysteis]
MTIIPDSNRFHRVWSAVIEASSAMVAIHYAAPWSERSPSRGTEKVRRYNG